VSDAEPIAQGTEKETMSALHGTRDEFFVAFCGLIAVLVIFVSGNIVETQAHPSEPLRSVDGPKPMAKPKNFILTMTRVKAVTIHEYASQ